MLLGKTACGRYVNGARFAFSGAAKLTFSAGVYDFLATWIRGVWRSTGARGHPA
jgi:hypothetical protein